MEEVAFCLLLWISFNGFGDVRQVDERVGDCKWLIGGWNTLGGRVGKTATDGDGGDENGVLTGKVGCCGNLMPDVRFSGSRVGECCCL